MIKVYIPDNFISERTYAVNTLLSHYCKVDIEIIPSVNHADYKLSWNNKSIIVKDHFFGNIPSGKTYLHQEFIPEKIVSSSSVGPDEILVLFGEDKVENTDEGIVSHIDIFAGTFFMLTRWEEAVIQEKDFHDRFPASAALVVKSGFILRPIVDEYAALLRKWLMELSYPLPEDKSEYKIVPTCDVDIPYYWRRNSVVRMFTANFFHHPFQIFKEWKNYKQVQSGQRKDPYDQYDYLMQSAETAGVRLEFNMIGGGKTRFEGNYHISDEHIKSLMQRMISRGHVIGAHASYDSFKNAEMIREEKEAISNYSGVPVSSSRQHYLRFDVPHTWRCLSDAGIKTDSTLGYAAEPGFRCGTSKPFPVFDIYQQKELNITERPLLIMDVSLRLYKKYSIEESIEFSRKIIDQVKKHNGELVFLWHNSSLSDVDGWNGWGMVLESLYQ
ncbi:MAG: polysaccharide deacetylase family protein [Saprospiraceae bacterium]